MWSDIFLTNRKHLLTEIDTFLECVQKLRAALAEENKEQVLDLLKQARREKERMESGG